VAQPKRGRTAPRLPREVVADAYVNGTWGVKENSPASTRATRRAAAGHERVDRVDGPVPRGRDRRAQRDQFLLRRAGGLDRSRTDAGRNDEATEVPITGRIMLSQSKFYALFIHYTFV